MLEIPTPDRAPALPACLPDPSRCWRRLCSRPVRPASRQPAGDASRGKDHRVQTISTGHSSRRSNPSPRPLRTAAPWRAGGWRGLSGVGGRQPQGKESNNIVVAAGDLISASPLVSASFLDEPSIEAMNLIHLDITARSATTRFDKGRNELLRMGPWRLRGPSLVASPCGWAMNSPARIFLSRANTLTETGAPLSRPMPSRVSARAADR